MNNAQPLNVPVPPGFARLLRVTNRKVLGIAWDHASDEPLVFDGDKNVCLEPLVVEAWVSHPLIAETMVEARFGYVGSTAKNMLVLDAAENKAYLMESEAAKKYITERNGLRVSLEHKTDVVAAKVLDAIRGREARSQNEKAHDSVVKATIVRDYMDQQARRSRASFR